MGKMKAHHHEELTNKMIEDTSSNSDISGTPHPVCCGYCLLCDEIIDPKVLCKHQGIRIEKFLEKYVKEVNNDIDNKQKEARSIQFYIATTKADEQGKKIEPFHILNIYGFKSFVLSHFIEN